MSWVEELDWGPTINWYESDVTEYIRLLKQHIGLRWNDLLDELNNDDIKYPTPDGRRYIENNGTISPTFAFDHRRVPWSLNSLLNERNSEDIWLTHYSIVGFVMDHAANYANLGFEGVRNAYFTNVVDGDGNLVTQERLVELGIVLFKRLWDNSPLDLKSSIHNIGFCVAYVHRLVLSGSYDAFVNGELSVLHYIIEKRPHLTIRRVEDPLIDTELKVDLEIILGEDYRIGIQVKPTSNGDTINSAEYSERYSGRVISAYYSRAEVTRKRILLSEIDAEVSRLQAIIESNNS